MDGSPLAPHRSTPSEILARRDLERAGSAFLVARDGADAQRTFPLVAERSVVGRRSGSDVTVDWDERVSRTHAVLERIGGEWTIDDSGMSRNGTYVNGERLTGRRVLRAGDVVLVGSTALAYVAPAADASDAETRQGTVAHALAELTPAQRRVLVALCRPMVEGAAAPASNQEIADELVLGIETVKSHLKALFERFELEAAASAAKRVELARGAIRLGIVS